MRRRHEHADPAPCARCGQVHSYEAYQLGRGRSSPYCASCRAELGIGAAPSPALQLARRLEQIMRRRRKHREWYSANRESHNARVRQYQKDNPARVAEWQRRSYAKPEVQERRRAWAEAWRQQNREHLRQRQRASYPRWRERKRAYNRRYREAHREDLLAYNRRYYQEHKAEANARQRERLAADPEARARQYAAVAAWEREHRETRTAQKAERRRRAAEAKHEALRAELEARGEILLSDAIARYQLKPTYQSVLVRAIGDGQLPGRKVGLLWAVPIAELEERLASRRASPTQRGEIS